MACLGLKSLLKPFGDGYSSVELRLAPRPCCTFRCTCKFKVTQCSYRAQDGGNTEHHLAAPLAPAAEAGGPAACRRREHALLSKSVYTHLFYQWAYYFIYSVLRMKEGLTPDMETIV